MRIRQITLNNYGPYAGRHTLDMQTDEGRPIILVGGHNGGGKTTLFESVMLCLYGRDTRETKKAYNERLAGLIHRRTDSTLAEQQASVSVWFQTQREGRTTEYIVERTWSAARGSEEVSIRRGTPDVMEPVEMGRDRWLLFVEGLVPRGIASLFFFDGERVAAMANEGQDGNIMVSFDSLLGIDVIDRLRSDLQHVLVQSLATDDMHIQDKFEQLTAEKGAVEERSESLKDIIVRKRADLNTVMSRLAEHEAQLTILGGGLAQKRHNLKRDLAAERQALEMHARTLAEACSSYLPFCVIPRKMEEVAVQMEADRHHTMQDAKREAAISVVRAIKESVAKMVGPEVLAMIDEAAATYPPKDHSIILDLSVAQQSHIMHTIQDVRGRLAAESAEAYSAARKNISKLENTLDEAPDDGEVLPTINAIKGLSADAGRLEAEMDNMDMERSTMEAQIRHLNSNIRDVLNTKFKNNKSRRAGELTGAVQKTLEMYASMLLKKKIDILESYVMDGIEALMYKDLIAGVSIDPETFAITIHDAAHNIIPPDTLSSGEYQILATAILWGLARTSGRPLPFMIDTPLARLDADHRANLLERFFPLASHQTIIFSTDTEIGHTLYKKIRRYVSKSYTLEYDPKLRATAIRRGYFGK